MAETNLSGLGILGPAPDRAIPGDDARWSSTQRLAPDSPTSLMDLPALAKSGFGLDLEISLPLSVNSSPVVILTFTVL